jgi:choline dehydrogenase-like flavoprotein
MGIIIAGSGPAAVSAAYCLSRKGLAVTMLDVGYKLEPQRRQLVEQLAGSGPRQWRRDTIEQLRAQVVPGVHGLPKKLVYGSDYPYRIPEELVRYEFRGARLAISHALGGLSNAWGANVLPFLDDDLVDWPIRTADLAPYYRAIFSFMDLSAQDDGLASRFPMYSEAPRPLRPSRQARALMDDLGAHRQALARRGFLFGHSRLAVRAEPRNSDPGCVYCGMCLYGCPFGLIYSSAHSLPELQRFPSFQYHPGYYVERVAEAGRKVVVHARRVDGGGAEEFSADRAFLGCGTISTTKIILESLGETGREVLARDNQYFLTPLLRFKGEPGVVDEELHTLSQVCLELIDPGVSERSVHMLVYSYNDLYRRALARACGPLAGVFRPIADRILSHMLVILGYLHSDDSPAVAMRIEPQASTGPARVVLEGRPNPRARPAIRSVLGRLRAAAGELNAWVAPGLTRMGAPGTSYHLGASLPMRKTPAAFECDLLGRPYGFGRVHVIDAACFPSVPATNATLSVMANAYRIADQGTDS